LVGDRGLLTSAIFALDEYDLGRARPPFRYL
jgi:hypothetical protein